MCIYIDYKYRCLDKWVSKYDIRCECICIIYEISMICILLCTNERICPKTCKQHPNSLDRVDISSFFDLTLFLMHHCKKMIQVYWTPSGTLGWSLGRFNTSNDMMLYIYLETHRLSLSLLLSLSLSHLLMTWPDPILEVKSCQIHQLSTVGDWYVRNWIHLSLELQE